MQTDKLPLFSYDNSMLQIAYIETELNITKKELYGAAPETLLGGGGTALEEAGKRPTAARLRPGIKCDCS